MSTPPDRAGSRSGPAGWGAVVPAKGLRTAKSRLAALGDDVRRDLVAAFLHDTVTAVLDARSVRTVAVVTDDLTLARVARELGALAMPDGHGDDLNVSLVQGAAEVSRREPALALVAVCADLPALTGADLDQWLLTGPPRGAAFVADSSGVGTTMLRAHDQADFAPAFGHGSREVHRRRGAYDLSDLAASGLRRDVDTPADLEQARLLTLGPRTRWVLTRYGL